MPDLNYYKILGVSKEATASQIKARYQLLAKKFHPDHDGDESVMSLINEAYQVLGNADKRQKYDQEKDGSKASSTNNTRHNYSQQSYTPPRQPRPTYQAPPQPVKTEAEKKAEATLQARIKQLEWWIRYPYLLPGIFGLFVIIAASTSSYVNTTSWIIWTIIIVVIFSYFYQKMLKTTLRKLKLQVDANGNQKLAPKSGRSGIIIAIFIIIAIAIIGSQHNASTNTPNTSNTALTINQQVINNKNLYYNPLNASTYPSTYEQTFSGTCLGNTGNLYPSFSQDSPQDQIKICGCTLANLEQNYTYDQALALQQQVNTGTPATSLDNLDTQKCSTL